MELLHCILISVFHNEHNGMYNVWIERKKSRKWLERMKRDNAFLPFNKDSFSHSIEESVPSRLLMWKDWCWFHQRPKRWTYIKSKANRRKKNKENNHRNKIAYVWEAYLVKTSEKLNAALTFSHQLNTVICSSISILIGNWYWNYMIIYHRMFAI